MTLERFIPLLQQEEDVFRVKKNRNKMEGKHAINVFFFFWFEILLCSLWKEMRNEETWLKQTQYFFNPASKEIHRVDRSTVNARVDVQSQTKTQT